MFIYYENSKLQETWLLLTGRAQHDIKVNSSQGRRWKYLLTHHV